MKVSLSIIEKLTWQVTEISTLLIRQNVCSVPSFVAPYQWLSKDHYTSGEGSLLHQVKIRTSCRSMFQKCKNCFTALYLIKFLQGISRGYHGRNRYVLMLKVGKIVLTCLELL